MASMAGFTKEEMTQRNSENARKYFVYYIVLKKNL
jgi:hypothetical protein